MKNESLSQGTFGKHFSNARFDHSAVGTSALSASAFRWSLALALTGAVVAGCGGNGPVAGEMASPGTAAAVDVDGDPADERILNPYEGIDWDSIGHHDANLHTHTNFSDGRYDPHYAIDRYHDLEYDILALTDHDSLHSDFWPKALYPWTELNAIFHEIKNETRVRAEKPYVEVVDEEWEDRDPEELGMLSIPGSEISRTHHISSLFNLYAGGTESEETAFEEIRSQGGIAVFNHPGRYDRDVDWYIDFFERFDHIVGMEIYNQVDRYPMDRPKWDRILYRLMPDRPVWGLANDDTHVDAHFGRNRNIFLLPDLTEERMMEAMRKGRFYLFVPVEQGTRPPVRLAGVTVSGGTIELELEGDYEEIEWITHNPEIDNSERVGTGPSFSIADLPFSTPFVRAVIISEEGRTYTQPFGVRSED